MALGCVIFAVFELAGFGLLALLDILQFQYQLITGAVGGTLIAILNFTLMCLMIQNATGIQDQKLLKLKVQGSYNLRLLVQGVWIVAAFLSPWINVIAAAIPLLFPTFVIWYLQMSGKLYPAGSAPTTPREPVPEEEDSEDNLNSFEV